MAPSGLTGLLTRVRDALAADAHTDAELVREYAAGRSEPAFAERARQ